MAALNIDPSAFETQGSKDCLSAVYGLLGQLEPLYLRYRGTDSLRAYVRHSETDYGAFLRFRDCDLAVGYAPRVTAKPLGSGIVIELSESRFLLAGMMSSFTFLPKPGRNQKVGILRLEEGTVENGEWKPVRRFNGDEQMALKFGDRPGCLMVELFYY